MDELVDVDAQELDSDDINEEEWEKELMEEILEMKE